MLTVAKHLKTWKPEDYSAKFKPLSSGSQISETACELLHLRAVRHFLDWYWEQWEDFTFPGSPSPRRSEKMVLGLESVANLHVPLPLACHCSSPARFEFLCASHPRNSYVEILTPNMMVAGGGAFGR